MGILLTILITIGKILLVVLGIILILLLLILFVPIRYQVAGEKNGQKTQGSAGITWLFRAVSFTAVFRKSDEGGWDKDTEFRLFGVSPKRRRMEKAERQKKKQKEKKKKKLDQIKEKDPERYEQLRAEAMERKKAREEEKKREEEEEKQRRRQERAEEREAKERKTRRKLAAAHKKRRRVRWLQQVIRGWERMLEGIYKAFQFLVTLPANISGTFGKFFEKMTAVCDTIRSWIVFLADPRTLAALKVSVKDIRKLWKKIRPKRTEGEVTYGLEDPAATGRILAFAAALFPVYGPDLILHPDFEKACLEGNIRLSGNIRIASVLPVAAGFLLDENVRYVISMYKLKKGSVPDSE